MKLLRKVFSKKSILCLLLVLLLILILDIFSPAIKFSYKKLMYSDLELINDTFNLSMTNQVEINNIEIYNNNTMLCAISIPTSEVNSTFKHLEGSIGYTTRKLSQLIDKLQISYEFDYAMGGPRGASKGIIMWQSVQKDTFIIFTKPQGNKTKVFMYTNYLGWN